MRKLILLLVLCCGVRVSAGTAAFWHPTLAGQYRMVNRLAYNSYTPTSGWLAFSAGVTVPVAPGQWIEASYAGMPVAYFDGIVANGDWRYTLGTWVWAQWSPPSGYVGFVPYSGPYKLRYSVRNSSSIAREYAVGYYDSNGELQIWHPEGEPPALFTLEPGAMKFGALTFVPADHGKFVVGRVETDSSGVSTLEALTVIPANDAAWGQMVDGSESTGWTIQPYKAGVTVVDVGGILADAIADPGEGGGTSAGGAGIIGAVGNITGPSTRVSDTASQSGGRITFAAAGGGALTENTFRTGLNSLKAGLDDVAAQVSSSGKSVAAAVTAAGGGGGSEPGGGGGSTNAPSTEVVPPVPTYAAAHALATDAIANNSANRSSAEAIMRGIGGGAGVSGLSSLSEPWNLSFGGGIAAFDINPFRINTAFSGASVWARWIGSWLCAFLLLMAGGKMSWDAVVFVATGRPAQGSTWTNVLPVVGNIVSLAVASIMVLFLLAVPVLFWTYVVTTDLLSILQYNPFSHPATGGSAVWIARFTDFGLAFFPLDVALVDFLIFTTWRLGVQAAARFAWSAITFIVA